MGLGVSSALSSKLYTLKTAKSPESPQPTFDSNVIDLVESDAPSPKDEEAAGPIQVGAGRQLRMTTRRRKPEASAAEGNDGMSAEEAADEEERPQLKTTQRARRAAARMEQAADPASGDENRPINMMEMDTSDEEDFAEGEEDAGYAWRDIEWYMDRSKIEREYRYGMTEIVKLSNVTKLREVVRAELWPTSVERKVLGAKKYNPFTMLTSWHAHTKSDRIAGPYVKMLLDTTLDTRLREDARGNQMSISGVRDEISESFAPEMREYLGKIKTHFEALPRIRNHEKLLWNLWATPKPVPSPVEEAKIGTLQVPYLRLSEKINTLLERIMTDQEEGLAYELTGIPIELISEGITDSEELGLNGLEFDVQESWQEGIFADILFLLDNWNGASTRFRVCVTADTMKRVLNVELFFVFLNRRVSEDSNITVRVGELNLCSFGVLKTEIVRPFDEDGTMSRSEIKKEHINVDLFRMFKHMVEAKPELLQRMESMEQEHQQVCAALEFKGVPEVIDPSNDMNLATLDKIWSIVENRQIPEDVDACEKAQNLLSLDLKSYQKRTLSYMLAEEQSPGGSARHLWFEWPLGIAGLVCYVSPALSKIKVSTSRYKLEESIGARGAAGWNCLEMGMGKTACAIGTIASNPPPHLWRCGRKWRWADLCKGDSLEAHVHNMPRGGTLIIAPTSILQQWESEFVKTLINPEQLSILRWDGPKRSQNARDIAQYDVILTTPATASQSCTLSRINWHRIVVDEAQFTGMGGFLKGRLDFVATNRWILTGTPTNGTPDSFNPSLAFNCLDGFDTSLKYVPAALAAAMVTRMVRYTKDGEIDGQQCLKLPPVTVRTLKIKLTAADKKYYERLAEDTMEKIRAKIRFGTRADMALWDSPGPDSQTRESLQAIIDIQGRRVGRLIFQLLKLVDWLRMAASGAYMKQVQYDAEFVYNEATATYEQPMHHFKSKSLALVKDIKALHRRDPEAKILVFSEFPDALRAVAKILPEHHLKYRLLVGGGTVKARGEAIAAFQTDPPTKIFLISARSGAVGVNLTAGSHVYLMEPLLNPSLEVQAVGRIHRIGQVKPISVTRFYVEDTVEVRVKNMMKMKRRAIRESDEDIQAHGANPASEDLSSKLDLFDIWQMVELGEVNHPPPKTREQIAAEQEEARMLAALRAAENAREEEQHREHEIQDVKNVSLLKKEGGGFVDGDESDYDNGEEEGEEEYDVKPKFEEL